MVEENGSLISTTGNTKWAAEQKVVNGKMEKTKSVVDFTKAVRSRIMDYFIVDMEWSKAAPLPQALLDTYAAKVENDPAAWNAVSDNIKISKNLTNDQKEDLCHKLEKNLA